MSDHHTEEEQDGKTETRPPADHPADNTAPPSNPEIDPERVSRDEEDAERTIAS